MPSFRTGTVTAILSEREGLQRVEVDGERAYVLTQLIGAVAVGDEVVMNTTAVELGLGTGGWHVVHWNLARREWAQPGPGHIMKLRYTSLQVDTGSAEEAGPFYPAVDLARMPVVACGLHSQVAAVAAAFKGLAPTRRLVYVMTEGGALPLAISDLVARLIDEKLLDATVTVGQAFGGTREAVSLHSGLQVADAMEGADAVVAGLGPGIVGTGYGYGYSGLDVVHIALTAHRLHATPVVAVRYSDADARDRHRGLSHHTQSALSLLDDVPVAVAVPPGGHPRVVAPAHTRVEADVPDVSGWPYTSMGRTAAEDRAFFEYAAAAGVYAAQLLLGSHR